MLLWLSGACLDHTKIAGVGDHSLVANGCVTGTIRRGDFGTYGELLSNTIPEIIQMKQDSRIKAFHILILWHVSEAWPILF